MSDQWTRRQVLGRAGTAAGGLAGLGLAGYVGYRWPRVPATAAAKTPAGKVAPDPGVTAESRHFVTRPDLSPPVVTVTHPEPLPPSDPDTSRYIFVAPMASPGQKGLMICDRLGRLVWFAPAGGQAKRMDFTTQSYRGHPVLTWWEGDIVHGIGHGTSYISDTSYRTVHTVQAGNGLRADLHEFMITPQDTALITAYRERAADLSAIGGPARGTVFAGVAQEIDIATGRVLFEWDSLDHVGVSETQQALKDAGTSKMPFDYFHINSIAVAPDGDLLISGRNTWAVYKVSRPGGKIRWRLGGKRSSFTMGPGTRFYWQHHARPHGARVLSIFDDGAAPAEEKQSRAILLDLDMRRMQASLAQAYTHPAGLRAAAMGDIEVLPSGRVFVGWGAEPYFSEFTRGGRMIMDGQFPPGQHSYRAFSRHWTGRPAEPPAIVARHRPGGGATVYVSWNGATEVDRWVVFAGQTQASVARAASQEWTGFETAIALTTSGPYFAAVALDAHGRQLGRSPTVRIQKA